MAEAPDTEARRRNAAIIFFLSFIQYSIFYNNIIIIVRVFKVCIYSITHNGGKGVGFHPGKPVNSVGRGKSWLGV